jgi:hypothetical protein
VWFEQRLVVPVDPELRKEIFDEAHLSKFSIHPRSTKMYQDLRKNFWWSNMKVDIAKYVAECDTCHRVKASHLKSADVLQPLTTPLWKWDDISMDFIVGLLLTARKKDFILVMLMVYFGAPSMFITLWFGFDYGTNLPLGTLIV